MKLQVFYGVIFSNYSQKISTWVIFDFIACNQINFVSLILGSHTCALLSAMRCAKLLYATSGRKTTDC
jgi:hypothetical protein